LKDPFSLVITASSAASLFGKENPMGKLVRIDSHGNLGPATFGEGNFKVTGVIQDPPGNSHISFDFLISYSSIFQGLSNGSTYWHWDYTYTYLLLNKESNIARLGEEISALRVAQHGDEMTYFGDAIDFKLQPIEEIHLHSKLKNELGVNGDGNGVLLLQIVMIGILLSAYINYINLSTVKAIERRREIGVRKVIGSSHKQLAGQLLTESTLVNVLAVIFAVLISAIAVEIIERGFGLDWPTMSDSFFSYQTGLTVMTIVGVGILVSVAYPVVMITRLKTIEALKKGERHRTSKGSSLELRTILIVVQFIFCIAFVAGTWSLYKQLRFMKEYDLGMNMDQVIVVKGYGFQPPKVYETFKSKLKGVSFVKSVGFSSAAPGDEVNLLGLKANVTVGDRPEPKELKIVSIDEDFFNTLEVALLAGRSFDPAKIADQKSAIVNESAARLLGFEDPFEIVEKPMHNLQEVDSRIVGVIKNYNQLSLRNSYEPIVYVPYKEWDRSWNSRFFFVKVTGVATGNRYLEVLAEIEAAWKEAAPEQPFQYFFLDSHFEHKYRAETTFTSLFLFFSLFAIVIACLGLFGLVAYSTIQRTKEIGIRKVLGATVENILALLSKDFFRLILVASLLAVPIVWLGLESWLNTYAFRIDVDVWLFVAPLLGVFAVALATVVLRSWRVAVDNPVNSLRYE
jgi:putative ABC transport system permease protein